MHTLLGREQEQAQLDYLLQSGKAEFVAVYGRRRVGKTYLISEHLRGKLSFYASGVLNGTTKQQKDAFVDALDQFGYTMQGERSWINLFAALRKLLQAKADSGELTVIFLDEIPCFDTQRSEFLPALDHFWNTWGSHYANVKFIVCGSATSWIIKNIIDNHGGLHNRLTYEIHLHQFSLQQVEQYMKSRKMPWSRQMLAEGYMVFGGVPFYWSLPQQGESLAQALDRLYCHRDGLLCREYDRLMSSLFNAPEMYMKVIEALAENKQGLTRNEIAERLGVKVGGRFSTILEDLQQCDFIRMYHVRHKTIKTNAGIYALTDMFSLFHLHFFKKAIEDEHFFTKNLGTPQLNSWKGFAFEQVAMQHIPQIKQSLGISGMSVEFYQWRSKNAEVKAQIDLILDRADGIANVCEMKYAKKEYVITKEEYDKLQRRQWAFEEETGIRKGLHLTFITPYGIAKNEYAYDVVRQVTLDDLFVSIRE